MNGSGCKSCPVTDCDAQYRGSRCAAQRAKHNLGDPRTNADRIRAMSDEELAVTLMCPNEMGMAEIPCDHSDDKNCCQCLLDWLQQPAEEG